ncbi:MAG TPA: 1-(5-phosphoribosyl)-5-((5-phosphoribosylamino)methylideneamino)imidazole-4-carboxamide isomerase [Nitrospiraceae bacterium]|nr:MAG: 1-(5-phosphoribosyl)-5-[(5-phosphoribosylamino)methylideneamino]imidazole-4-carboxamide isomerase [Nitrospirae bacterium GWA2_46_11]OGW23709.1 MAG: 1-(5-phosphoribosyl)-5-[(5-phosphoribosylamino)methylideneamino]imidazole-4-carboxamide isomerase [Nitrospirae bacterium GWB2_47_37]HAK89116.1 1-(5-phosphoribosyl)-5-((5-phosphoribosylamino)methylideneamino)imidazole-4-carboxamide isomerase [Nitrospiraceae bacterium]HCZ12515.1 1-(5-phosphoribosyl)-5-((5-phosphoribosylamino)methylideneamino)im
MIVIPAIDLKDGKCVRLLQGKKEDATVYSDDPASTAKKWEACGAKLLHVVDLDGAFTGSQKNIDGIKKIRGAVNMEIEVGGGIRDMERIDLLVSIGINRVILGTVAVEKPELVKEACGKYPGRVLVGIDAKNGLVAVKGWVEVTEVKAKDLAVRMQNNGAAGIIYTDISKDGMMTGPNIEATREMVESLNIPIIASGGVSSINDIKNLSGIKGLWGAITGKAIYSGAIDLKEAIRITEA